MIFFVLERRHFWSLKIFKGGGQHSPELLKITLNSCHYILVPWDKLQHTYSTIEMARVTHGGGTLHSGFSHCCLLMSELLCSFYTDKGDSTNLPELHISNGLKSSDLGLPKLIMFLCDEWSWNKVWFNEGFLEIARSKSVI